MTTNISRRAILAGAAVLPALAVPAIAAASTPQPNADAELIELGNKLEAAVAKTQAHMDGAYKEATDRYEKLCPSSQKSQRASKLPAKLDKMLPPGADGRRTYLTYGEYIMLAKFAPKHPVVARQKQVTKKPLADLRTHRAKSEKASKDSGFNAAEKEHDRLADKEWAVFKEIINVRAKSPEGMAVKCRAAELVGINDDIDDGGTSVWKSLRTDILSMTSAVQS
jgi:hypothetical protein